MPVNHERFLSNFLELVQIPSPSGKESEVASAIKAKLQQIGLTSIEDDAGKGFGGEQGNLIVNVVGTIEGVPPLLLNAHIDTVIPCEGVKPIVENDTVRSDGTTILGADDKSGVCILLELLNILKEDKIAHGPLEVVFTVGEETGLHGAKNLDYSKIKAKFGFVFDGSPPINKIIVSAPSQNSFRAIIKGKSAHAGVSPEKGVNAIALAAKAIASMELGRIDFETTANIGIIKGGLATNIVPEEVIIDGEARSHDQIKLDKQIAHMSRLLRQEAQNGGGLAEVNVWEVYRAFKISESDLSAKVVQMALERMNINPQWETTGGGSDANVFNERGIQCLIVCSGHENPHSPENERLNIKVALQSVTLAVNLVCSFAEMMQRWY